MGVIAFVFSRLPFPSSKARDAVGEVFHHYDDYKTTFYSRESELKTCKGSVILHASAGREASDFNELVLALNTAGYHTYAVEAVGMVGNGLKDKANGYGLKENMSIFEMTDPIFYTIKSGIRCKNLFLIGHAYGNRIVRAFAHQDPKDIDSVILLAAGGQNEIDPPVEKKLKDIFNPLISSRQRQQNIAEIFFAPGNKVPDYWKRGWHTQTAIAQGKAKGLDLSEDWQGAGGVPLLVVQPANDIIAPKEDTADVLLARYPDQVEVVFIENAGHALLPEQPEAVADAVIDYLDRMSRQ